MRSIAAVALAVAGLLAVGLTAGPARAASYRGRSVDGLRYQASILNYDYGKIDGVEVRFQSEHAYVYLIGGGRIVLILRDEEITNAHSIPADDPLRGTMWEISVKDLGRR